MRMAPSVPRQSVSDTPISRRAVVQRQLTVGLVCLALLGSVVAVFSWRDRSTEWKRRVEQADHRLALAFEIISRELSRIRSDLLFMANHAVIRRLSPDDGTDRRQVEQEFAAFLRAKGQYQQIRVIDLSGMEVARVDQRNGEIKIIPQEKLQNKSNRYYIRDAYGLKSGEVFVSQFDLNEENGIIERPLAPVIRFVTPIENPTGEIDFLLVVNYLGQPLLDDLADISLPGNTYLIRDDGEYLLGPTEESAWGWLLGHSRDFIDSFPATWPRRYEIGQSVALTSEGAFAFRDIGLEQFGAPQNFVQNSRHWLSIVSHHPPDLVFRASNEALNRLLILVVVSLIPMVLLIRLWAVAAVRRQQNFRRVQESESQLRELSELLLNIQEDERKSISREIHDQLGQQATAINLDLKLAAREDSLERIRPLLQRAIAESGHLLETLHDFATRIRPPEIDDLGLNDAVETCVWEFQSRSGIECQFVSNLGSTRLPPTVAINVFRLIQEALNNVLKHAQATSAQVRIEKSSGDQPSRLQVTISDNGIGAHRLDGTASERPLPKSGRLGILGMNERVQLLGGHLEIESVPGTGTAVHIELPMEESESADVPESTSTPPDS